MVTYLVVLLQFQISIPTDIRTITRNTTISDDMSTSAVNSDEMEIDLMTTMITTLAPTTTRATVPPARGRKG